MWQVHEELLALFFASFDTNKSLILYFDAADDTVHGQQENRFFSTIRALGFLLLYVFCGNQCLVNNLRLSGAKHSWAVHALLVKRQRQACGKLFKNTICGDSGFYLQAPHAELMRTILHTLHSRPSQKLVANIINKCWIEQGRQGYEAQQQKKYVYRVPLQRGDQETPMKVIIKAEHEHTAAIHAISWPSSTETNNSFTKRTIIPTPTRAKWKTASRNNKWICLQTAPVAVCGDPINS